MGKIARMENTVVEASAIKFHHPFTMCVAGSTGSGKSVWIRRLLAHLPQMIDGQIGLVLYCYGELNPGVMALQRRGAVSAAAIRILVHAGMPSEEQLRKLARDAAGQLLVVLDDLMVGMDGRLLDILFTRGSHNWGASCILVTQHLFTKELRVARNNAHYIVLMKNPAGALQVRTLAAQLFPGRASHLQDAYADATRQNFGYLLIDLHPLTSAQLRLRTNIYPDEESETPSQAHTIVYST